MNAIWILKLTSLTYLGLLAAGCSMPRVVGLREHLRSLPVFIRRLFWVYYAFIGLCLISFGLGSFVLAEQLVSGTVLARSICGFLAVFWLLRWVAGTFIFDLRPYLTTRGRRLGLLAANGVFTGLPLVYGWLALRGGNP